MACPGEVNGSKMLSTSSKLPPEMQVRRRERCRDGLLHRIVSCGPTGSPSMYHFQVSRRILVPEWPCSFVGPLSPTTRRYLDINDSATAESSKKAYQMATPSHARRTPTLSRAKSTTALVLRPTPVLVESHTRTVSVQTVQLAGEPTRPLLRTVRSTNFRDGTSGAKHATRPLSREQPRHQIQPLVYETTRPRSVASHRHERPPSSRSIKEADVVPVAEAAPAPNSAPTPLSDAMSASANTRSGARLNAPVRERQYPFTGPGFVPKSRREREAEAVRIPLPPSPTSSHQSLPQVPVILPSEPVTEPSIPKELTPPPSVAPPPEVEPVTSKQASIVSTGKKFAASLVNKLQPSFRPRRGGAKVDLSANNHTQPQAQARKVSAFGAPAVITTVQPVGAPPAPVGPPPAAGTTTRGAPKNKPTLHIMAPPGTGSRSAASSVSSRSVSAHIAVAVAAANSAVGPGNAESVSHPSKPAGSSRVVSNPAPSAPKPTLTHKTDRPPKPATHNHEPRIRNATGMTLSQLLKQKPPVHKKGFAPTNKLRSAKSSANLKGAVLSAQKQQPPSFDQKSSKVEPEIVACVSLPSSSEGEVAHPPPVGVPLPPSPVVAAAQLDVGLTLEESQHHTFPTIESIKERLSDVLGSQSPSSDSALACSVALAVAPIPCVHGRTESEPELTLNDLELLPHTPPTLISTQAVSIIEDLGGSDDPDITPIAETGVALASEFIIPASHPSSPAKTGAEKLSRELEMRTVLREVGTNMDL